MKKILFILLLCTTSILSSERVYDYRGSLGVMVTHSTFDLGRSNYDGRFACYSPRGGFYWENRNLVIKNFICNIEKVKKNKYNYAAYKSFNELTSRKGILIIRTRHIVGDYGHVIGDDDLSTLYFNIEGSRESGYLEYNGKIIYGTKPKSL